MRVVFKGEAGELEGLRKALFDGSGQVEVVDDLAKADMEGKHWVIVAADELDGDEFVFSARQGGQTIGCDNAGAGRCGAEIQPSGTLKLSCALRDMAMKDQSKAGQNRHGSFHFEYFGPGKA